MKRCPACNNTYTDNTLQFCLQDGTPLEDTETGEQETVVRASVPDAPTVAFEPDHETEVMTRASIPAGHSETVRGSHTLLIVVLTAFLILVLFGVIGLSGYLYLNRNKSVSSGNANASKNGNSGRRGPVPAGSNRNSKPAPEPTFAGTPTPDVETSPKTPEPNPSETPDLAGIENEISEHVGRWKALAESRNIGPYMDLYADRLDYYRKRGASKVFVGIDKRKAFSKYPTIRIKISGLTVSPSVDGKTAEAVFDKEWLFANAESRQTGKVKSRLIFQNIDGAWKIVSEKDIKTYYVRK